jgi:hypothetical protein
MGRRRRNLVLGRSRQQDCVCRDDPAADGAGWAEYARHVAAGGCGEFWVVGGAVRQGFTAVR